MNHPIYRSWDDYFIPGTEVLRNKFFTPDQPYGEENPHLLRKFEEFAVSVRLAELKANPIQGSFDYEHMKTIHAYLFQDVYEWAGEERTAPNTWMTKDGHAYYPAGPALTRAAEAARRYARAGMLL